MCPTVTGNGRTGKVLGPSGSSAFPLGACFLRCVHRCLCSLGEGSPGLGDKGSWFSHGVGERE